MIERDQSTRLDRALSVVLWLGALALLVYGMCTTPTG